MIATDPIKLTSHFMKDARTRLGLTQEAMAELLGTSRNNINNYENGKCRTPGDMILRTQDALETGIIKQAA